jgi:hypothetical protein
MRLLLKLGADYNARLAYFNRAPLSCVLACLGHTSLLKELVNHLGAEFKFTFDSSSSSSSSSSSASSTPPLDIVDENGTSLLSYATQHNQIECCRFILASSAHPVAQMLTRPDSTGVCPFTYVVAMPRHDMIELLDFYMKLLLAWSPSDDDETNDEKHVRERKVELIQQAFVLAASNANRNCLVYLIDLCILNRFVINYFAFISSY